ncbi:putative metal homeostasis protein [Agrilactobacillus fermenti]|nr:putative metal homeostasis protein [Agrilactobacillus fermenti]MCD2256129.1 putative metal homeostasis protein [Agrilactobacillus fermenti]
MTEKTDMATAQRNIQSKNIKTRKRALKLIKQFKRNGKTA